MTLGYMDKDKVSLVPAQRCMVNGARDYNLVCNQVASGAQGHTASFELPRMVFDADKRAYYTSELTVYAESNG